MPGLLRKKLNPFSSKSYWREILAVLMLLLAVIFFRSERRELNALIPHIRQASPFWLLMGFTLTACYFILQGGIYRKSFAAIGLSLSWVNSVILFLKRNFISVFWRQVTKTSLTQSREGAKPQN